MNAKVGFQSSFIVFTLAYMAQRFWHVTDPGADETLKVIVGGGKIISMAGIAMFGSLLLYRRFRPRGDGEASNG